MLKKRVIPCLDVKDGRVVKGVRFQGLRDAGDPAERAASYADHGADEILLLDVSATIEARRTRLETVAAVRERIAIPLVVGGGVRDEESARALLETGADKVALNSAAVADPSLVTRLARLFGAQAVLIAIDAARAGTSWRVLVRSGTVTTELDATDWAIECERLGAGEVLLTAWDRDGTRSGYELELIARVSSAVRVPVIASGGAANAHHMIEALRAGADAVLAASIFHDGETTVDAVKQELRLGGMEVRT